jgi:hypothetical protein
MRLFSTISLFIFVAATQAALATNKIKCYFNHPVDVSVSTGTNAVNISGSVDDSIAAYINRAKYSIDCAIYNFSTSGTSLIAPAINSAYSRGVKVRWIYDGGTTNSGLPYLASIIPKLGSPTSSDFTIMHHKFMVIDANSPDPNDAVVWTGSTNWNSPQFNDDYNNIIIIQDSGVARAYRDQFNMMWGDTGMLYNTSNSKFGHLKRDLGRHLFNVDGTAVEVYFSPADNTNDKIVNTINTANKDLYFAMYTFTFTTNANAIVARKDAGVYVAGINDTFSRPYTPYSIFTSNLGANFIEYSGSDLYHNKFLIVDPSDKCSDPIVLTGSHNWSISANTDNDENTLIVHDATIANQYYQSFRADFAALGGTLSTITGCPAGVGQVSTTQDAIRLYPMPVRDLLNISAIDGSEIERVSIRDLSGRAVMQNTAYMGSSPAVSIDVSSLPRGQYLATVVTLTNTQVRLITLE